MEGVLGGSVRQADTGLGVGADAGVDLNADMRVGVDFNADVSVGAGVDLNADMGVGVHLNADVGVGVGVADRPAHAKARPEKHAQRSMPEKREPVPGRV
ncbi:hypothetical protein ACFYYP_35830 [Microbispora rosea]|uniref:hypothetical protein n=1 Tax=Microbispora rosea TaxID=58117 RepID=UPI0036A20453